MAIDLNQYLTVTGLSALLMLFLTFVKQYIPTPKVWLVPFLALALGILLALLFALAQGLLVSLQADVSYFILGLLAGLASIGVHEATLDKLLPLTQIPAAPIRGPDPTPPPAVVPPTP